MSLGEDHTTGTRPGTYTPRACVASNDLALGRIVEAISHSKYWPEIAIFVIEDDAQNGPDHVDAHRTVGLVISPYTKRKHLDSSQYSTVSMIRTIELILGLRAALAVRRGGPPDVRLVHDKPDLTPYVAGAAADRSERGQRPDRLRRRPVEQDGFRRVRQDRRLRAQRDPLAGGQGKRCPRAARRAPGDRLSAEMSGRLDRSSSSRFLERTLARLEQPRKPVHDVDRHLAVIEPRDVHSEFLVRADDLGREFGRLAHHDHPALARG